ncbi:MAG: response regulator transcription factor [Pseudomonadota bacterium]
MKILVVEDDQEVADYVIAGLHQAGHSADAVVDGHEGLLEAARGHYDVLVVDRMLPGLDGLSLIKGLRAMAIDTPALILSAMGSVEQRVEGLRAGSDDYLTKPFAFSELLARVEILARRPHASAPEHLEVADLLLNPASRTVERAGTAIDLQPKEFALLEYLMRNAGQVVTRTMLLEHVWQLDFDPKTNIVDVHVSNLRQKIDRDYDPKLIHTVRGSGYVVRA